MKRITITTIVALLATFQLIAYTAQEAVDKFVSHSSLRYASVGVQVIDLDSAMSIASYRPDQANITASTMKTVVSSAALGLMGPHFRFETPVYLDGEVQDGHFKGDIVISTIQKLYAVLTGQRLAQTSQPTHNVSSTLALPSLIDIAGQPIFIQLLQPTHLSVLT